LDLNFKLTKYLRVIKISSFLKEDIYISVEIITRVKKNVTLHTMIISYTKICFKS
jgi:hypothetical protein